MVYKLMMRDILIFSSIIVTGSYCYCPPLSAPKTTQLSCELPDLHHQPLNCGTSWLPEGAVAYFTCADDAKGKVTGRIVCYENGEHFHISKYGNRSSLPCGITRDTENPEIHIYGYQTAKHYDLVGNSSKEDFRTFGESLHNEFRLQHGAPPLKLDANLSSLAQEWAEHIAATGRLEMASQSLYGQNVFLAPNDNSASAVNGAVHNWYEEGKDEYCWEDVSDNWELSLALDFSQLVWKDSKLLGIGAAKLKKPNRSDQLSYWAVVAFYFPSGNIVVDGDDKKSENLFKSNVQPLIRA